MCAAKSARTSVELLKFGVREGWGRGEFLSCSPKGIALLPYPCCSDIGWWHMHEPELSRVTAKR